jgi:hypothetical protein
MGPRPPKFYLSPSNARTALKNPSPHWPPSASTSKLFTVIYDFILFYFKFDL